MKHSFLATCAIVGFAAFSLTSLTSCDEEALNNFFNGTPDRCSLGTTFTDFLDLATGLDCVRNRSDYDAYVADMGQLLTMEQVQRKMVEAPNDFAMAMTLNASAINKLFRSATNWQFDGIDVELPTIQVGGCKNYSTTSSFADHCLTFVVGASIANHGVQISLGVPIVAEVKGHNPNNAEDYEKGLRTTIFADLPHAELVSLKAKSGNTVSELPEIAKQAVTLLYQTAFEAKLRQIGLFDIYAWEFDFQDNPIKLVAGSPVVNEQEGTLTLGMFSNINLGTTYFGENGRVTWDEAFPKDAEIGLHIHPDLIRGIIGLMFHEGHVSSEINTSSLTNQSSTGASTFEITMASMHDYPMQTLMQCGENWRKYFTLGVRFWSLANICGYADLLIGFNLEASDNKFEMGLGNVQVGASQGIGAAFKIAVNNLTQTQTFQDILKYATFSFNYDQFRVPVNKDSDDGETTKAAVQPADKVNFNIDGNGIGLYLNFVDL